MCIAILVGIYFISLSLLPQLILPSFQLLVDLVFGPDSINLIDSSIQLPQDVRVDAQYETFQQLTILGNGSGAPLPVIRNFLKPYLGEFLYLNLVHKFGIFSIPFFFAFFWPLFLSLKLLLLTNQQATSSLGFVLLGSSAPYLAGFYTPIVFSPFFLFLLSSLVFFLDRHYLYRDPFFSIL
jgi:hypothetical protein